jgi:hypothetical protein
MRGTQVIDLISSLNFDQMKLRSGTKKKVKNGKCLPRNRELLHP